MSEWRGNLHPRDRRGRFRDVLERLAAHGVEYEGGSIARNRRGYFVSRPTGAKAGQHLTARSAVDRMIAHGKASPGVPYATKDLQKTKNEIKRGVMARHGGNLPIAGIGVSDADARRYLAGWTVDELIAGRRGKASPGVSEERLFAASWRSGNGRFRDLPPGTVRKERVKGTQRYVWTHETSSSGLKSEASSLPELVKLMRSRRLLPHERGKASPGAMSFTRGNVQTKGLGSSNFTPAIRQQVRDRNTIYSVGLRPGDPVSDAAQALADLYRAQDDGAGEAQAKRRVESTWSGLDTVSRARARRLATHMHARGAELRKPRVTSVAA